MYVPWWASYIFRARELKGAMKVWELWDGDWYPGLGRIIHEFASATAEAEGNAMSQYHTWNKGRK